MEELTIEQKAKRFDEAMKVAKDIRDGKTTYILNVATAIEAIFPELKEEEDELTWLINYISEEAYCLSIDIRNDVDRDILKKLQRSLVWLKKQCKNNMGISEATKQKLEDSLNKALEKETPESCNEFLDEQGEQKSTDKIQIGKEYRCIASPRYSTFITGKIYKPEDEFLCSFMNFYALIALSQ